MIIQLNTDNNLSIKEAYGEKINSILTEKLDRFSDHITRIEVFLSDENGAKKGVNDRKCILEARLEGRDPIAVSEFGNSHDQAISGAIDKLKASLDTIIGRMRSHS
ncbi:MAG TPA: HPF/RaiA family ribosome-associated protein [Bacteroidia bacterium]|nr:HPF/RaiA family ribosome-associated protein [Bacteroidia bacterium]